MRRVVITGIGLVTPLGNGVDTTWRRLIHSESGIRRIDTFNTEGVTSKVAGLVPQGNEIGQFNSDDYLTPKERRKVDDFIVYGIAAAEEALKDSGWVAETEEQKEMTGVMIGSGVGGLPRIYEASVTLREEGARKISPFFIPSCLINLVSGQFSIRHGFKGPNHAVVTACSTGAHAIGDAGRLIQWGDADVMIAGGAEASVCEIGVAGFCALRALSTNFNDEPTKASRPWDQARDGFVIGEGAGIVVLEEYEHAKKRGAKIYAEILGYGLSGDAYHITAPSEDGNGGFRAMRNALKRAQLQPEDIGYVNAHGTSTPLGDMVELNAVKRLFGQNPTQLSMSSTKSAIGHLLGAAGGVEAIFSILALRDGILPPTLNLENPSEGCKDIDLIPLKAKEKKVRYVMSNSFGFGGTNASLIFGTV
ncbi:MAG: beta-ketoacyl-ACP synthase II [Alphaproteobacteria bacterium]|jgi:3-oxoacyl-[acyl-carrier-protein] synthase II|nr:beta-ketoacyl-ACP synthase II [Alphaproteobacteria bacterium]MBP9776550.1 beta-ketoacyl-ACP synthase II [Alphaproteobacteria bacterium]